MQFITRHFRQKAAGVADLLNWAALIDSGIVLNKDGSLMAGFMFRGPDLNSSTNSELNYMTRRVNVALLNLGSGWATWVDAVRLPTVAYSPPEASFFPDRISQLMDDERRHHFEHGDEFFETEYALVVTYKPPLRTKGKMVDLLYDTKDEEASQSPGDLILKQFKKKLVELQDALGDVVKLRRMVSFEHVEDGRTYQRDELVNYLHMTLTGELGGLNVPSPGMYLDCYIGGQDLWGGSRPKIGERYTACVAIEGFPAASHPGILDVLDHMAIPYRWSTRMIYLDHNEQVSILNKTQRKWDQKKRGLADQIFKTQNGKVNADAQAMAWEVEAAITDANSGLIAYGYYTPVVVLMDEDRGRLEENARIVAKEIARRGFATRIEDQNALGAFLGTLPGHTLPNVRRPLLHTLALADMLPLSSAWPGLAGNPCPFPGYGPGSPPLLQGATAGATPFRLNLHVGDLGHTLVLGPTGAGKSVLLNTISASAFRYKDMKIMAFDKGRSALALCLALGGKHYDLAGENSPGLCPLRDLETANDLTWAAEWLAMCFELQAGRAPSPAEKQAIFAALRTMQGSQGRSLTDFCHLVQSEDVRAALQHYTLSGSLGGLLDAEEDGLALSQYVVAEIGELMNLGEKNLIPVLSVLFRRFEQSLDGNPALLVLDEAWIMLGHPVFREKIREWLKVLRKANCAVIIATQSLSDAHASGILDVLQESCPTKIFLPNPEATKGGSDKTLGPRDFYEALGLNEREIEIIAEATKKRHYYYTSPEGQRLFTLELGPVFLSFVAVSDPEAVRRVTDLHQQFGDAWPEVWLRERRVNFQHLIGSVRLAA